MNIRHRITLLVAITFTALVSIGGYAIWQSRNSANEVRTVTEGVVPSAL
ncbi:MAG: four helix bundle sensory module for signal transduction family protein, partial [Burkholderiaceae bacterium]|nr:four helix bundle sensory module for signal transduction family protein [Burkholderiaceae bacterium]